MPCIYQKNGCHWNGRMEEFKQHLLTCRYDWICCPQRCGKKLAKVSVDEHVKLFCTIIRRPCRHCGLVTSGQEQINHSKVCKKYPILCPNECDIGFIIREDLEKHLKQECMKSIATCSFKAEGCRYEGPHAMLTAHMETCVKEHLILLSGIVSKQENHITKLNKTLEDQTSQINKLMTNMAKLEREKRNELQKREIELNKKLTEQQNNIQQVIRTVKETENKCQQALANLKTEQEKHTMMLAKTITSSSYIWKINDFQNKMIRARNGHAICLQSPVFFYQINGYKLQGSIYLNGDSGGCGEFISLYICLLPGENDNDLIWPFPYNIKFTIVNQNPDVNDAIHRHITLDTAETKVHRDYFKTPRSNARAMGFPKFLSHQYLYDGNFLKNNTLIVKYTFITRDEEGEDRQYIYEENENPLCIIKMKWKNIKMKIFSGLLLFFKVLVPCRVFFGL